MDATLQKNMLREIIRRRARIYICRIVSLSSPTDLKCACAVTHRAHASALTRYMHHGFCAGADTTVSEVFAGKSSSYYNPREPDYSACGGVDSGAVIQDHTKIHR